MTQLVADFAAKGLLNLMTSSPVATGLAHGMAPRAHSKVTLE